MFNRPIQVIIIELRNLQKTILGLFFSFIFPLITMYFIINSLPLEYQKMAIQEYFPVSLALGITPLALLTFPASISKEYESGVFLRYKLFDISLPMVFISKIVLYFLLMLLQIIIISLFAIMTFGLEFPSFEVTFMFFTLYILASLPMFLIGTIITIITKNNMMVQSIGLTIMFIFLILSNAMMPVKNLPEIIESFKFVIPTNDIIQQLGSYWRGIDIDKVYFLIKYLVYTVLLVIIMKISIRKAKL
ncbi:ABC transporter permease [Streptobacillus ratti]|uniref:ABC transporter permease n=1 Tax=Streptobacillus ratti TaxID=1720557 RepID=UPI000935042A|nr:ABC transporter permease [Streptobacillus ratti]